MPTKRVPVRGDGTGTIQPALLRDAPPKTYPGYVLGGLILSYARIATEEGVAAMEGRCIDLNLGRRGSRNKSKGLASAGGEGWLYFWDLGDNQMGKQQFAAKQHSMTCR